MNKQENSLYRLYEDKLSLWNKIKRSIWQITRILLFVPFAGPLFTHWRIFILKCFGAVIGKGCRVDASCKIWWPKNLIMGNYACLAESVDCFNISIIKLEDYSTISQRVFLCSASHSTDSLLRPLVHAPITIKTHAWVCAEAFVGPGVTIYEGAVLGARAVAMRNLAPWSIYAGNPARLLKKRIICK